MGPKADVRVVQIEAMVEWGWRGQGLRWRGLRSKKETARGGQRDGADSLDRGIRRIEGWGGWRDGRTGRTKQMGGMGRKRRMGRTKNQYRYIATIM
jgi:hypothetical protein